MTMTEGMDEVMAAVDAVHLAGWMRHGLPSTQTQQARKAVEQAVARYADAKTERLVAALRNAQREAYAPYVGDAYRWDRMRVIIDRALAGEQEPARSDGGTE